MLEMRLELFRNTDTHMALDLAPHIEKLIFLHDTLIIPGFGGFTASRSAASVDYAGGMVMPPSRNLSFNENLTVDDGILANDVGRTYGISHEQARLAVHEFVDQMQRQLNQREIINLPGVGRLYKNYIQKIQFLPDGTNFNTESYGLPPLQFSPIARSRSVEEPSLASPAPPVTQQSAVSSASPVFDEARSGTRRRGAAGARTIFGILLLLGAVTLGLWYLRYNRQDDKKADQPAIEQQEKPGATADPAPLDEDTPRTQPAQPESVQEVPEPLVNKPNKAAREADVVPSADSGQKECILVVATLQDETNVRRLTNMLESRGYEVYHVVKNGHQVGIRFPYGDITEVRDKILDLKALTGESNIWIKQK